MSGAGHSLGRDAWRRLLRNRAATAGLVLLALMGLACLAGPELSPYTYDEMDWNAIDQPPGASHWLGTDESGRDLLTRTLVGGRISFAVALAASLVSLLIGVAYGGVSGYLGGKTDAVMMRIVDVLYGLPFTLFVILLVSIFGRNLVLLFVAIGAVEWLTMARIVRGQVLGLCRQEFVEACRVLGYGHARVLFRHVLPNVLGTVVIYITLTIPGVMLFEAFLSFLGLGVQPPMSSWGSLIKDGVGAMEDSPWQLLVPAGALFATLLSLNFLGDGLRDALDPRRAGHEPPRVPAPPGADAPLADPSVDVAAPPEAADDALLEVRDLCVSFPTRDGELEAARDVGFTLRRGETLGIVGESGSGKSVSVSALMGLVPAPPARVSGSARFRGRELLDAPARELRRIRGDRIAMIFQDPMTSLNPHQRVVDQVAEPLRIHGNLSRAQARARAVEALASVGIPDPERRARAWPHEFSGGMRQRVMIAMAMITEPELLIADEPTTALDVTVQRQILELIDTLRREHGTSVLLISHDLAVVANVCSRILVMREGRVVERGDTDAIMNRPRHPYTRGLLQCHPALHAPGTRLSTLEDPVRAEEEAPAP